MRSTDRKLRWKRLTAEQWDKTLMDKKLPVASWVKSADVIRIQREAEQEGCGRFWREGRRAGYVFRNQEAQDYFTGEVNLTTPLRTGFGHSLVKTHAWCGGDASLTGPAPCSFLNQSATYETQVWFFLSSLRNRSAAGHYQPTALLYFCCSSRAAEASDFGFLRLFLNPQNKAIHICPQLIISVIFVEESG